MLPEAPVEDFEEALVEREAELPADLSPRDIDLQALAEAVYQLLKRELRLERERLGR